MWNVQRSSNRLGAFIALMLVAGVATPLSVAQELVKVYAAEVPGFALREAADVFNERHGDRVVVVVGTMDSWQTRGKEDADVLFASAGYIMSDMRDAADLQVAEDTVTPLYVHPAAILVRPDNPKKIRDFPDVLKSGVRIMVVAGSAQAALWEEMAGTPVEIEVLRRFKDNVVVFAPSSEVAERTWRERDDIDAWVTWNTMYLPLHQHADLVSVSNEHVVYRQCSAALTRRGKQKPAAQRFLGFIASADGARIFESWGWVSQTTARELSEDRIVSVVCRIDDATPVDGCGRGLLKLQQLLECYEDSTHARPQVRVVAVIDGDAVRWLLSDDTYRTESGKDEQNPNKPIIQELMSRGVSIEVSGKVLTQKRWEKHDLIPGVSIVADTFPRIVDLQLQGYAYLSF